MSKDLTIDEWLTQSSECLEPMASLIRRFGADCCAWALDVAKNEEPESAGAGRKKEITRDRLRDVWLFVEVGKMRAKQSAKAFCDEAEFAWVSLGPTGAEIKLISGPTLRRRYQEAVAFLRAEGAPLRKLAELRGIGAPISSPTETWWRKLLDERIRTELSGNSPKK